MLPLLPQHHTAVAQCLVQDLGVCVQRVGGEAERISLGFHLPLTQAASHAGLRGNSLVSFLLQQQTAAILYIVQEPEHRQFSPVFCSVLSLRCPFTCVQCRCLNSPGLLSGFFMGSQLRTMKELNCELFSQSMNVSDSPPAWDSQESLLSCQPTHSLLMFIKISLFSFYPWLG